MNIQLDLFPNEPILVIGDIHGNVDSYWKLLQKHKMRSLHVGDFGFGKHHRWHLKNIDSNNHKVNFGNHDDYHYLDYEHSAGDASFSAAKKLMTIRGAQSIDRGWESANDAWWPNEELNYVEMTEAVEMYERERPLIVVTHDCPQSVRQQLFKYEEKSRTSNGLQAMFELHQPDMWVFGHYHTAKDEIINGTRFICLPISGHIVI